MALAPRGWSRKIQELFRRAPVTVLQPASITPEVSWRAEGRIAHRATPAQPV
jgi:hypothetical protein